MRFSKIIKLFRWVCVPVVLLYQFFLFLHHNLYAIKLLHRRKLPVPTISVGNIQLGGTGKSTLVIHLIEWLERQGKKVAVLTRGYGRKGSGDLILLKEQQTESVSPQLIGDEPGMIFDRLRSGALGVGANRFRVGKELLKKFPAEVIVLDDALQHRKLKRDLDICLIDVSRWSNLPILFPFTYLRDLPSTLRQVDFIILTKYEGREDFALSLQQRLREKYGIAVEMGKYQIKRIVSIIEGEEKKKEDLVHESLGAFCGIANPEQFKKLLESAGFNPVFLQSFPDHHFYSLEDLRKINQQALKKGVKSLLTTTKDAVKIKDINSRNIQEILKIPVYEVEIDFVLTNEHKLLEMIGNLLGIKS